VEEFEIGDEGIDELNTIGLDFFQIFFFIILSRLGQEYGRTKLCRV
jgi:hypothetical protein